jgi:ABC-type Zn uptake system ZnuABC Zn-binding protein ZnuA
VSLNRFVACALVVALCACSSNSAATASSPDSRIVVMTSISTFNSFVEGVGGSHVRVQSLVPIGASPEDYQPTPQDEATLSQAAIFVENGAGLETWIGKTIANTGSSKLKVVVCTDGLPVKLGNPHLWMDPQFAKHYVDKIREALVAQDPAHADEYRANAGAYNAKLDDLTKRIAARINTIPKSQRAMIVFHNAWQYYNDRFGIETLGFIETNPGQEPNPQQIAHLIDVAKSRHLRAIFSEPEYSPKLAQQIAGNANIKIVDNLYDDSIATNGKVRDYVSMLNYDTDVIVKALL